MAEKRHLNVIPASATGEEEVAAEARSSAGWILIGALMLVILWLPLEMLGLWLTRWIPTPGTPKIAPIVGTFALSACLAGATIGRFARQFRIHQAALAGGLGGALAACLAAAGGALRPLLLGVVTSGVLCGVGAFSAACGGRWGRNRRNAASLKADPRQKA